MTRAQDARQWLRDNNNQIFLSGVAGASGNLLCEMLELYAAARCAQVEAHRHEIELRLETYTLTSEQLAKRAEAAESDVTKLREALRLAADRFKLAYETEETISCDVWAKEAETASREGDNGPK